MTSFHPELLNVLACPKCRNDLTLSEDEKGVICEECRVIYPIITGVPQMTVAAAQPLVTGRGIVDTTGEVSVSYAGAKVRFSVVDGKNKGETVDLAQGMCRAIGRSSEDIDKTSIFSVDSIVSLDENTKKLVMQYLSRQFQKSGSSSTSLKNASGETYGHFVRGADYCLRDSSVSKLHAMIFYDEVGGVGVLDLVSRNGTFVNGAEVESHILKKGDLITIGQSKVRFEG